MKSNKLIKSIIILVLSSILLLITSCKESPKKTITPIKIEFKKEGDLQVFKADTDSLRASYSIEIADNDYERQTGLMHRHSMDNDKAMLFIFPDMQLRAFYMKNTYLPLDIIYIDDKLKIVSIQDNAKPLNETSLPSNVPAKYVLEINAGLVEQLGITVGDSISFSKL